MTTNITLFKALKNRDLYTIWPLTYWRAVLDIATNSSGHSMAW